MKHVFFAFLIGLNCAALAEESELFVPGIEQTHEARADTGFHPLRWLRRQQRKSSKKEIKTPVVTPGMVLNIGSALDQNHFELQLAASGEEKTEIIPLEEIAEGFEQAPYFVVVPYNGYDTVQFWAPVNGPTTSGSSYPRCELRQVNPDGTKASFDAMQGTYWMEGKTRITHLPPSKPEVVVAQLFDGNADRVAIRTQLISGQVDLVIRINGKTVKPFLASPYIVGDEFAWKMIVQDGLASVYYNDMNTPIIVDQQLYSTGSASWYFKTGCYSQTNSSIENDPNEYVSDELRDLSQGSSE